MQFLHLIILRKYDDYMTIILLTADVNVLNSKISYTLPCKHPSNISNAQKLEHAEENIPVDFDLPYRKGLGSCYIGILFELLSDAFGTSCRNIKSVHLNVCHPKVEGKHMECSGIRTYSSHCVSKPRRYFWKLLKGGAPISIHMSPQNWNFQFGSLVPNHVIGSLTLRKLAHSIIRSEDTLIVNL